VSIHALGRRCSGAGFPTAEGEMVAQMEKP
jgi:hypothetical protein